MSKMTANQVGIVLKKGKYIVTDPCYVFPDSEWSKFCDTTQSIEGNENCALDRDGIKISYNGIDFFVCGTKYGDGCFPIYKNGIPIADLGVDAGLLSVIPVELLKTWKADMKEAKRLGVFITLDKSYPVKVSDGDFSFGPFEVFTGEENPYNEEDDENEDVDEDE